jgi:hypothetical protein
MQKNDRLSPSSHTPTSLALALVFISLLSLMNPSSGSAMGGGPRKQQGTLLGFFKPGPASGGGGVAKVRPRKTKQEKNACVSRLRTAPPRPGHSSFHLH